jgi:ABC-type branched-subunit amino acid transport system permease subunit
MNRPQLYGIMEDRTLDLRHAGAVVLALAVLPLVLREFFVGVLTEALILGLFAVATNIALGYSGLITLAPAAFFGIGAYGVGKVVVDFGGSFWLGILAGIVMAVVFAVAVGYVPIKKRIGRVYFALFTMAFGVIAYDFVYTTTSITGGSNGLSYISPPDLLGVVDLSGTVPYYYFVLAMIVIVSLGLWKFLHSDYGTTLHATRQNELRMRYLGYNTDRAKLVAWIVACAVSAFAGSLYAGAIGIAAPSMIEFALTGEVLIWVTIGGVGTLFGPFIAAFSLTILEWYLGSVWADGYLIIIGLLFVAFVFLLPSGIMGYLNGEK